MSLEKRLAIIILLCATLSYAALGDKTVIGPTLDLVTKSTKVMGKALTGDLTFTTDELGALSLPAFRSYSTLQQFKLNAKLGLTAFQSYSTANQKKLDEKINKTGFVSFTRYSTAGSKAIIATSTTDTLVFEGYSGVMVSAGNKKLRFRGQNLTGPITAVNGVTSVTSQTGTGSKFVMDTLPTFSSGMSITPMTSGGTFSIADSIIDTTRASGLYLMYANPTKDINFQNGNVIFSGAGGIYSSSSVNAAGTMSAAYGFIGNASTATALAVGGTINRASCWKVGGVLGYCSTVVAADGSCTCN